MVQFVNEQGMLHQDIILYGKHLITFHENRLRSDFEFKSNENENKNECNGKHRQTLNIQHSTYAK